jgi:hypothetical protein
MATNLCARPADDHTEIGQIGEMLAGGRPGFPPDDAVRLDAWRETLAALAALGPDDVERKAARSLRSLDERAQVRALALDTAYAAAAREAIFEMICRAPLWVTGEMDGDTLDGETTRARLEALRPYEMRRLVALVDWDAARLAAVIAARMVRVAFHHAPENQAEIDRNLTDAD